MKTIYENNPFHIEGSVWTHTMCVCSHAQKEDDILQWACLLHDIGKPDCREIVFSEKYNFNKTRFINHAGYGVFKALEVLYKYQKAYPNNITNEEIKFIIKLIAKHQDLYLKKENIFLNEEKRFVQYLKKLTIFDGNGAIPKEFYIEKDSSKFIDKKNDNFKNEIIILIGVSNSGKSYFISKNLKNNNIISRDKLVEDEVKNKNKIFTYNEAWKYCKNNNLHNKIDEKLRKNFQSFIKVHKTYKKTAILILSDYDNIINRNYLRKGKIFKVQFLQNMMKRFSYPDYSEFDEIKIILN